MEFSFIAAVFFIVLFAPELIFGAKPYTKNTRASLKAALNETKKVSNETKRGDRLYLNPLLSAPEPSLCDLTPKYCDLQCCSDKDCSAVQREAFKCAPETEHEHKHNFWSCKEKTNLSSWHPFFCFVTDNSPYLGKHFLPPPDPISDATKFAKVTENNFHFRTENTLDPEVDPPNYQLGARVQTLVNNRSAGHLLLPVNVPGTYFCARSEPLRFLQDKKTVCLRELTAESCASDQISVDKYLDKIFSKSAHGLEKVNSTVLYLCSNQRAESKVRVQMRDLRQVRYGEETGNSEMNFTECINSMFLSSFFDPRTKICYSALLEIDYKLTWNGTNITSVNATFFFADVPMLDFKAEDDKAPKLFLSQKFQVAFEHVEKLPAVKSTNESVNSTQPAEEENLTDEEISIERRSGNPGYLEGKPLIIGILTSSNNSAENVTYEWEHGYLNLLYSNLDGDCVDVIPAAFAFDALSACKFKLSENERNNCSLLSETLGDFFGSLYFGEHVAKKGDLLFTSTNDVVPILWSGVESNSSENKGCLVAAGLGVKVLFSEHSVAGVKLSRVVGVRFDPLVLNISLPVGPEMLVSTSIQFLRVNRVTKMSRFWSKMMEHSENSWLEMFDPLVQIFKLEDHMEEVIVFWTFLVATSILLLQNTNFGFKH